MIKGDELCATQVRDKRYLIVFYSFFTVMIKDA